MQPKFPTLADGLRQWTVPIAPHPEFQHELARFVNADSATLAFAHELAASRARMSSYLAKNFTPRQIYDCLYFNYLFLSRAALDNNLGQLAREPMTVWTKAINEVNYSITIYRESFCPEEGEWVLDFWANDVSIYVVSFNFVPGSVFGLVDPAVLLVSRMQGRAGCHPFIVTFARAMLETSPQALMFAMLRGFARIVGIRHLVGPTAENQVACKEDRIRQFRVSYDEFFQSLGVADPVDGFYVFDTTAAEKSILLVPSKRRARAEARRRLKREFSDIGEAWWKTQTNTPAERRQDEVLRVLLRAIGIDENIRFFFTKEEIQYQLLKKGLVDIEYYLRVNGDVLAAGVDPVRHYLIYGANERRNPNQQFDTARFFAENPGAKAAKINPAVLSLLTPLTPIPW